ncbi:MAG TPA: EscU/YscU/HrcU family type III secretion system export apparatus switch protein [Acidimicrobiales bacterium]|nr:EscU/YscU/HrcU family type III secretion system export apparatus switch protein [Acidimicrobiales bacterium]
MAGDKHARTEKPSARRKREARQRGQVAKSPDVSIWALVMVASFVLPVVFTSALKSERRLWLKSVPAAIANPDTSHALGALGQGLKAALTAIGPMLAAAVVTAVVANISQTGLVLKKNAIGLNFSRLSPKNGLKRVISLNGLSSLLRSLVKLAVLGLLAYAQFRGLATKLAPGSVPMNALIALTAHKAVTFIRTVAAVGLVLGLADYFLQRRRVNKQLMMTKQEVKEEHKSEEGRPEVKAAIRRRQVKMSRMRMMAEIAHADVVIVNPTHVSVALRYEPGKGAPRVVAKGADEVAAAIREEAAKHNVPVVEDVPLARTLWQVCEVDEEIPADMFEAVARVLAFIYGVKARGAPLAAPIGGGPLRVPARL